VHPDIADCLNIIGILYDDKKQFEDALVYYRLALKLRKKIYGKTNKLVGDIYFNLGILFYNIKKQKERLRSHQKALRIFANFYGRIHQETNDSQKEIAIICRVLKETKKAHIYKNFRTHTHPQ
jgi:nephrocystin-3